MRRLRVKVAIGVAVLGVVVMTAAAVAGSRGGLSTGLSGYEEVPAISTDGEGSFRASLNRAGDEMHYRLRWSGLEGGAVRQAHIHFGQKSVNGGISVWLCSSLDPPGATPAGTQPCPQTPEASISGTITAANVVGPGVRARQGDRASARASSTSSSGRCARASRTPTCTRRRTAAARSAASSTRIASTIATRGRAPGPAQGRTRRVPTRPSRRGAARARPRRRTARAARARRRRRAGPGRRRPRSARARPRAAR